MLVLQILGALVGLVVLLLIIAAVQSDEMEIVRSTKISTPPGTVFPHVNDFHNWEAWSPWEKLDPNLKRSFEGPASGVGAIYGWEGDKNVGSGRMTIVESRPSELIRIKLEFLKPFPATNEALWTFKPDGNQTDVTWKMTGKKAFMMKLMGLFMNLEKMIGKNFEDGLAALKTIAEGSPGK
ncbi:MAG: SRPBCC family protein [Planctomycetales bacterium]